MNRNSAFAACAIALAGIFSSGCMSMMLSNAPTTKSFEDPPVRETVAAFPRETIVGKWSSTGKEETYLEGKRALVLDTADELNLQEDGTGLLTMTKTMVENRVNARYRNGGNEVQIVAEGNWDYKDGILKLDLSTEVARGFIKRKVQFKLEYTVKWHSDEEFSLSMTEEQAKENMRALGVGGWDTRTVEPNGVETYTKKGIPLMSPDQKAISYSGPFKRREDNE